MLKPKKPTEWLLREVIAILERMDEMQDRLDDQALFLQRLMKGDQERTSDMMKRLARLEGKDDPKIE